MRKDERECQFCKKTYSLLSVEIDNEGHKFINQVCNNCYDMVWEIASKMFEARLTRLQEQIDELRNGEERI